ncbi:hypothetical protein [Pedobacter nanyangensis]|uniref:hypothetical protein n=1 Tax=Pedobacter nanyangensis TaxID=1562389 RepID=UPI0013B3C23C|nr:hypothetical protein [Pedobacter nanyangensis]
MKWLFLLFMLVSLQTNAQISKGMDSIFLVKDYLLHIQKAVNTQQPEKEKIAKLDSLIRLATEQKAVFGRNLSPILKNEQEAREMKTSLNFILQSMVLYRSDLQSNNKSQSEILYLNKNIPILINKIYFYCKRFQNFREEKTH